MQTEDIEIIGVNAKEEWIWEMFSNHGVHMK